MSEEQKQAPQRNQQAQLGIGTLVIIALIVTMCSGKSDTEKVRRDTAELRKQVGEINRKLDELVSKAAPPPTESVEAPDADSADPGK